jgi:hypothetical protein
MRARKNWLLVATVVFVCAVARAGCGKKDDAPNAGDDPEPAPPGQISKQPTPAVSEDLTKEKPEATYTIEAFIEEMRKDSHFPVSSFPVSKHAGKVIEVRGVVTGYGFGPHAGAFMLKTGPHPVLDRPEKVDLDRPWTKALPTQTVTLRARVATSNAVQDPYHWQFIKTEGPLLPTITAEELVKERETDASAFDEKYKHAWVMLNGTISETKTDKDGGAAFQLAAGDKKRLLCTIPARIAIAPLTPAQTAALKPGTKVKLLGRPAIGRVSDCIVFEPAP